MKRSPIKRRTSLASGGPPRRRTRVKPVNRERKADRHARNFGDEAERVRVCEHCLVGPTARWARGESFSMQGALCSGPMVTAHVVARGMGGVNGGRFDLVAMCRHHHDEQHAIGVESFAAKYRLDLRAEADRVAIGHASPLGIRGLAQRWACELAIAAGEDVDDSEVRRLGTMGDYEWDALMGWVRREMAREAERSPRYEGIEVSMRPDDRDGLARHIADKLGGPFADAPELAWALCDAAGWPGACS